MRKFEVQGVIGMGAYGVVLKAVNKQNKEIVAIKKFKESDQNPIIRKIALREVKALKNVQHENIVQFKEAFRRENKLNIVFEYVPRTVLEDIEESPQGVNGTMIQSYSYQLLKGLRFMHKNNYVHRDIKPENLLVDSKGVLKLCDFGFARKIQESGANDFNLTNYVATRWYRSPELIITNQYGPGVDIWAVGCIVGELLDGQPMFPGDDTIDQIYHIISILGPFGKTLENKYEQNEEFKNIKLPRVETYQTLEKRYKGVATKTLIDLMKKLLQIDEKKRITANEALKHKYFKELFDKDIELQREMKEDNKENLQKDEKEEVKKQKKKDLESLGREPIDNYKDELNINQKVKKIQLDNISFFEPTYKENVVSKNKKKSKKSKTLQPKKMTYATNDSRIHSKIFNKASSTNFIIKKMFNFKGTFYNSKFHQRNAKQTEKKKQDQKKPGLFPYIQEASKYKNFLYNYNQIKPLQKCFIFLINVILRNS